MKSSPWFLRDQTSFDRATPDGTAPDSAVSGPPARVYCFPHAGGNPRSFLGWQQVMGNDAEVVAVCPPGRGPRFQEHPFTTVAELADGAATAISATADRPFVLFGHSFGAVLAFEVARRVGSSPYLRHLVASGCSAPALLPTRRVVETARLEGRAFTEAVGFFGGLPPEVVADEALQELLLPHLRADFRMVAGYTYRPADRLAVPVTLVNGVDDPHVKEAGLDQWARECSGEPTRRWVDGGHFYFDGRPDTVTDVLRTVIQSEDGPKILGGQHVEVI